MTDSQPADEQRLLQQAQGGDTEAFGLLYEQYAPAVFRFLYAHLDDRLDAEDLTEEVFFRVWQSLPGYEARGVPFGGFVFRVARNALYDHYRRSRRQPHRPGSLEWAEEHHAGPGSDPAVSVLEQMEHRVLHQTLGLLREDHRQVLSLRFLAGLTPEETAQAMGKSTGAIRVLQHRALAALKKLITRPEVDGSDAPERDNPAGMPASSRSG